MRRMRIKRHKIKKRRRRQLTLAQRNTIINEESIFDLKGDPALHLQDIGKKKHHQGIDMINYRTRCHDHL